MIFTQRLVHVDSNVYFKIVMKHCQISSVNKFSGFLKSLFFFRAMSEPQKFAITVFFQKSDSILLIGACDFNFLPDISSGILFPVNV